MNSKFIIHQQVFCCFFFFFFFLGGGGGGGEGFGMNLTVQYIGVILSSEKALAFYMNHSKQTVQMKCQTLLHGKRKVP